MFKQTVIYFVAGWCVFVFAGCQGQNAKGPAMVEGKSMFTEVKVAAISFVPEKTNVAANVEKLEGLFRQAAGKGAELAVAPEGIIEGWMMNDILKGEYSLEQLYEAAQGVDGEVIGRFRELAKELDMCLAFGFAERIGGEIYNCAIFIDNKGKICGRYYKMQFSEGYHRSWWFNRLGTKSRAFDTPFGRCGFMICNDRWNPDLARIAVLDGAQFLIIPSFGDRSEGQDAAVLARARENGVPIVEANVGVTLVVSKGEIVFVSREEETVSISKIEIPARAGRANRDKAEKFFLNSRDEKMERRYKSQEKNFKLKPEDIKQR